MPVQSNPSIPPILGLAKTAVLGVIYNLQKSNSGLKNGRRYWEGGGIGREAVSGGAVLGGTTVYVLMQHSISVKSLDLLEFFSNIFESYERAQNHVSPFNSKSPMRHLLKVSLFLIFIDE